MDNLRKCPFCGGNAILIVKQGSFHVECNNAMDCLVMPITWGFDTEKEAIDAWNKRED